MLHILHYPDPLLARPSEPIAVVTDAIRQLAAEMVPVMYQYDGVGLAAPQVGHHVRLVLMDITGPEQREGLMTLVNPVATPIKGAGHIEDEEGCLSVPDFRAKVRRLARVRVQATDLDGHPIDFEAEGLLAVCVQHEIDHLDGKLFIDRISYLKRMLLDSRLRKQMK